MVSETVSWVFCQKVSSPILPFFSKYDAIWNSHGIHPYIL